MSNDQNSSATCCERWQRISPLAFFLVLELTMTAILAWAHWDGQQAVLDKCAQCQAQCSGKCVIAGERVICVGG